MINTGYSVEESIKMLKMMEVNRQAISAFGEWPKEITSKYQGDTLFFFTSCGEILVRTQGKHTILWTGPLEIDDFWARKVSRSVSFQCAKFMKSLQRQVAIKNISHLLCRFHRFDYIPSQIII